jgi:hypothetical protein
MKILRPNVMVDAAKRVAGLALLALSLWGSGTLVAQAASTCPGFIPATISTPANLIAAVDAANSANCPGADTIDLGGNTISFTSAGFSYGGDAVALPDIVTPMTITNGTITRSSGTNYKYIHASSTTLTLSNLIVTNGGGASISVGGAVHTTNTNLTVSNSTFSNNAANAYAGGAIFQEVGPITVTGSIFRANSASFGGAIFTQLVTSANIDRSQFYGNSSSVDGGALVFGQTGNSSAVATVNSSLFVGNSSNHGASIYCFNEGSCTLRNSTIAGDRDTLGSLFVRDSVSSTVSNSIIWGGSNGIYQSASTVNVSYSAVKNWAGGGTGNITTGFTLNQIFVDPNTAAAADTGSNYNHANYDWRLLNGSPAINAGSNVGAPATDLAGNTRIQGGTIDIGAYEGGFPGASVSIAVAPGSVAEDGAANLVYTVTSSLRLSIPIVVNLSTSGSATSGVDYIGGVTSVTIPAEALSATITINPTADSMVEADETVIIMLAAGSAYTIGAPSSATGTILNDDVPNLTINDVTANEGNSGTSNFNFTVSLSAPAGPGGVSFNIATANGTATAGSDYVARSLTGQTIAAGSSSYAFAVVVNGDTLNEANETFFVNVTSVTGAVVVDGQGVGTITNDDPPPSLSINDVTVLEGNSGTGNANFTVTLSTPSGQNVTVNYATADGTATAPGDYTSLNGALLFTPGTTALSISVPVIGDTIPEANETFFVNLSGATNATIADNQGIGTITDDDLPGLSIGDVSIAEGNSGTSILTFTVTRTGTTASAVGFSYATADGTATSADGDYVSASGTGTISGGGATGTTTVNVTINGDAIFENTENFVVNLTAPTNAAMTDGQGLGTILNDDTAGFAIVQSGGNTAVTEGGATDSYTVALTSQPTSSVSVTLTGTQVAASPSPLSFTSGNWNVAQTVTVTAIDDAIAEGTHAGSVGFVITSGDSSYNALAVPNVAVTITDNESAGITATPTAGLVTTEAGSTATFTVRLDSQPTASVVIGLSSSDPSEGTVLPSSLTFTPSQWSIAQTVTVSGVDDFVVDGDIAYSIVTAPATSADPNYGGVNPADVAVTNTDNDSAAIEVTPISGLVTTEAGGTATFTVRLGSQPTASVSIGLTSSDTSEGTVLPASLTFTAANWNTLQTVTVSGVDDFVVDGDIAYSIVTAPSTSADPNYVLNAADVSVSNTDNDSVGITVTQSGGDTAVTEGGVTDTVSVVLTSQPTGTVTMALTGTQVTPIPTPLSFTTGNWNTPQLVTVTAIDDAIAEGTHAGSVAFAVTSSDSNYNALAVPSVAVTITDNDSAGITVTPTTGLVTTEAGGTAAFTVRLTSEPIASVSIGLSSSDTTEGTVAPASLTFTAANWNILQTVTVTGVDDAVVDGDIAYSIITAPATASDPNYGGVNPADVSVTNNDNDVRGIGVTESGGNTAVTEGGATDSISVVLSSQPTANVSIALSGVEVTPTPTPLVFTVANWNTPQTITVTAIDDTLFENNPHPGSVSFAVTSSDAGYAAISVPQVAVSVTDNDPAPTISITSPSQPEGDAGTSVMSFVVSLSAVSALPVTFNRATADGSATVANNDYVTIPSGALTIPAGQQTLSIPVTINGDSVFEGDESFSVVLTAINGATPTTISGTGTMVDDDQQPTTTTIISDTPDPSLVGQPYTVSVNVVASSSSPLGTITISDGTDSCGPVTLVAGTSPSSSASCDVSSSSVGNKTLTATYTPASTAYAPGTGSTSHQVTAASTTISVSGPPRSRIHTPTAFSFALAVTAPGAGTPTGTVSLSSGSSTCLVNVPGASSCNLSFDLLGPRTVSASFAPSNGNHEASSSSGAGDAQTFVYAQSDLAVTKTDTVSSYQDGDLLVYTITLRNLGADTAADLRLRDTVPAGLTDVVWSCDSSGGATCPASSGTGSIDAQIASYPVGALLNYTFFGNVSGAPEQISNTATVELPADGTVEDGNLGNNSAIDLNQRNLLFADGFEAPTVTAAAGSYRFPSSDLRGALDATARVVYVLDDANGQAARVYARVFAGQLQYALAQRAGNGFLRLGAWRSYGAEPTLSWSAAENARGWVVQSVTLD